MTDVSLASLFRACLESFSIVGTAKSFGEEYELLCTELSILQLRFRLWGQQLSLESGCPNVALNSALDQPDIKPTIIQTLQTISYLLEETNKLRYNYSSEGRTSARHTIHSFSAVHEDAQSSFQTPIKLRGSVTRLRHRFTVNKKQIPLLHTAKWTVLDARTFSSKIVRLRGYVDGLEKITQAITSTISHEPAPLTLPPIVAAREEPPPYAAVRPPPPPPRQRNAAPAIRNEPELPRIPENADEDELPPYVPPRPARPSITSTFEVQHSNPPPYSARRHGFVAAPSSAPENSSPAGVARQQSTPNGETIRPFKVRMDDLCPKVLQAALKRYNLNAPASEYALYIVYGNVERCVTANEKPLVLFKQLDREGKQPSFLLRKCTAPSPSFAEAVSNAPPAEFCLLPVARQPAISPPVTEPATSLRNSTFPSTDDLLTTVTHSFKWSKIGGRGAYRYEIGVTYKHNVEVTILRTSADFYDLHQSIKLEFAVWDNRLPRLPRHLTRRTNFLTSADIEAFHGYFAALMGIGDGIHLSAPFKNFFTPRLGDQTQINFERDA